jgi:hypothetical protein
MEAQQEPESLISSRTIFRDILLDISIILMVFTSTFRNILKDVLPIPTVLSSNQPRLTDSR